MKLSWHARGAATAERMRRLMQLRGVTPNGHPLWNQQEVGDLVDGYPDYRSIFPKLVRRTQPATYSKAGRLGITQPRGRGWDDNDILRLRIYRHGTREEILAAFPGRTWAAIAKKANSRGIYRAPRPIKPTGIRIVDQILDRALHLNLSKKDLDEIGRRRGYFTLKRWKRGRLDYQAIYNVVTFLGGTLRASWAGVEI